MLLEATGKIPVLQGGGTAKMVVLRAAAISSSAGELGANDQLPEMS